MNINTQNLYLKSIDRIVQEMQNRLSPELKIKISEVWKEKLFSLIKKTPANKNKSLEKLKIEENCLDDDSFDDEIFVKDCQSVLFGNLKKISKKSMEWMLEMNGCTLNFENKEYVFPRIKSVLKHDFY